MVVELLISANKIHFFLCCSYSTAILSLPKIIESIRCCPEFATQDFAFKAMLYQKQFTIDRALILSYKLRIAFEISLHIQVIQFTFIKKINGAGRI